jgi:hypothetical protein
MLSLSLHSRIVLFQRYIPSGISGGLCNLSGCLAILAWEACRRRSAIVDSARIEAD